MQVRKNMSAKKINLSKECGKCADMHVITKMYRAMDRFTNVLIRNY
jgi:ribosomal protein L44E